MLSWTCRQCEEHRRNLNAAHLRIQCLWCAVQLSQEQNASFWQSTSTTASSKVMWTHTAADGIVLESTCLEEILLIQHWKRSLLISINRFLKFLGFENFLSCILFILLQFLIVFLFFLGVCVHVCMCANVCVAMQLCAHACGEKRTISDVIPQASTLILLGQGLSPVWNLPSRPGCFACKLQWPAHLCLHSPGIANTPQCAQFSHLGSGN